MKIGVFGGTFDPPHAGHLAFALAAREQLELDEVLWMPAQRSPQKTEPPLSSGRDRFAMVGALASGHEGFAVSDLEIVRGGQSYAVQTMAELSVARPADYWFLVGADALKNFSNWKQPDRLMRMCRLAVALRPPHTRSDVLARLNPNYESRIDFVDMPPQDASSTELRRRLESGLKPVWLDPNVLQYIEQHGLYRNL